MRTPETMTARERAASLNLPTSPGNKQGTSAMTAPDKPKLTPNQARLEAAKAALHRDSERSATSFDPMDEIDGSIIVLDVFDIDEYSLNPRKKVNSQRAEIKASMKVDGITNMFSVTRRNPTEKYFPYGGGNTRVEIAKELVNEGVEKLRNIHVVTRKWPGEAAVIAAHLSENDNRGDISFWERAQGVINYKSELEKETKKSYSASELNKALKEQGLGYGIKMIQNFLFAAENLSLIGDWLQAREVNESIRPTVSALLEIASKFDKRDEVKNSIEEIFLMHATDLESMEQANSEADPASRTEVKLDVPSLLTQIQSVSSKHFGIAADHIESVVQSYLQDPKLSVDDMRSIESANKKVQQQAKQAPLSGMLGGVSAAASPSNKRSTTKPDQQGAGAGPADQLAAFSARLSQNLVDLNAVVPLSDFVKPMPALPYGFLVDIPERMSYLGDQKLSEDLETLRVYLWPFLATQTGQCNANLLSKCDPDSRWVKAIQAGVDTFRQECTDRAILCGKNGQLYVTSDHYGYLFGNAAVARCLSALMQTLAEFNIAVQEDSREAYKPLFTE
ncbi:hypothetical protein [Comamonas thiooxydans]|uniref:hypothetical protein n=1 Tax=Comamonas thiooxydans TaxID=363952 RepID=UPI0031203751